MTRSNPEGNVRALPSPDDYQYIDLMDFSDDAIYKYFAEPGRYEYYDAWYDYVRDFE